jgi:hypothetical protein
MGLLAMALTTYNCRSLFVSEYVRRRRNLSYKLPYEFNNSFWLYRPLDEIGLCETYVVQAVRTERK